MPSLALACRLSAVSRASRRPFSPASLFSSGEQGAWYDPSDFSTMFEDSAGTIPITTPLEKPVGLILDKSKGLVLGPELVTNGDFSNGTTGWTVHAGWSVTGGAAVATATSASLYGGNFTSVNGRYYRVEFDVISYTSGTLYIAIGANFTGNPRLTGTAMAPGRKSVVVLAGANNTKGVEFYGGSISATIDNISIRELPGNHAYQTTSASRPVLSARVNQYLNTATLATQNVTTLATTYTLRFDGAGSITLSGTATGTYTAGVHSVVCAAGTLTSTVTGTVTNADLRPTNSGVNLPPYQCVGASTDYDTAGFPHYLKFDGIDDSLVTNSIDFTGTDKMTVCAGVRKLRDTSSVMVCELSTSADTVSRAFYLAASAGASPNYITQTGAVGARVYTSYNTYTAPITNVIASQINNTASGSDDIMTKINGIAVIGRPVVEGAGASGNFGDYPLNIGSRNKISHFYNGHLYSLVVCGKLASAAEITATEAYINQKTRAY